MRALSPNRKTWKPSHRATATGALLLALGLAFLVPVSAPAAEPATAQRPPTGLDVLRRADAALRAAAGIRYDFEYLGTGTHRTRIAGTATWIRLDDARSAYRAEIDFALAPPGFEAHPKTFALASDGQTVWRRDDVARQLERASVAESGGYMTRAIGFALLPQWRREAPFGVEMNDSDVVRHAGRSTLDGVECDVVFVRFPPDSGLGDQYFWIGREDGLPRRVTLVSPGTSADLPTWHFELRLVNVERIDADPRSMALTAPAGYRTVDADRRAVGPGAPSPSWRLTTADGSAVALEDLRGQVALLDFWASWCPFCTALLPATETLRADYAEADVAVYAVHIWDSVSPAAVLRARGIDLPILTAGDTVADLYKVGSTPTALVIGRDGRIVHRDTGSADDRDARLRAAIDRALAESSP